MLHWVDWTVLILYLTFSVLAGVWIGRGARDLSSYLVGDRNLSWWWILGSLVATETSTATFLSVPGNAWQEGGDYQFLQLAMGFILGRVVVSLVLLPLYFQGQLYTAYEVLSKRFGPSARRTASLLFLVTRNLGDGLRLFLAAIALNRVVGWSLPSCIILVGLCTMIYTVAGGMKSVIFNDCLQFVVYLLGGVLALSILVAQTPGGWSLFWEEAQAMNKTRIFDFSWDLSDAYTLWAGLIGGAFLTMGTHGTDQMMVQRLLCARNRRDASLALIASGFVVLLQFALFLTVGVGLAVFYRHHVVGGEITKDFVFADFIVNEMPAGWGLIGLLLASVFAAAMSTLSSSLNSSATAVIQDWVRSKRHDPQRQLQLTRMFTVVFGIIQIGIGIAAIQWSRSVVDDALAIAGFSAGVLLGVFSLGILTRRPDQIDAIVGMLGGILTLLWIKYHPLCYEFAGWAPPTWKLAWPWWPVVGAVTTFLVGWIGSRLRTAFFLRRTDS